MPAAALAQNAARLDTPKYGGTLDIISVTPAVSALSWDNFDWIWKHNQDSSQIYVRVNRDTRIQTERTDRLRMHLFQHQIHHRGQAHAKLSGTAIKPPQLDEFFSAGEAPLRATEFASLGWTEDTVWRS